MPKQDTGERPIEWFGADVEEAPAENTTAVYLDGFRGVDHEVIRPKRMEDGTVQDVPVRRPAPRIVQAKTTAGQRAGHDIGKLTARYKLMRSAFEAAPLDDKEMWERRMNIALAEMQAARFRQKLERYQAQPNPRPEQVKLYRDTIAMWRGRWMELTGQG